MVQLRKREDTTICIYSVKLLKLKGAVIILFTFVEKIIQKDQMILDFDFYTKGYFVGIT